MLQALFLGIVQGLTEFLPVSSSGHLVFFQKLFGISEPAMTFDVLLHAATLIAVFAVFWGDIWALLKKPFQKTTYLLIAGTIPTVIIALLFKDLIDSAFQSGRLLGFEFIITGLVLLYADYCSTGTKKIKDMTYVDAAIIGVMQGVAIMPAISRSGMTITGALMRGIDKSTAARYSFLLSIPAIIGAFVLSAKDMLSGTAQMGGVGVPEMAVGFIAAAVSGYFAVKLMLNVIKKRKLKYFSYYVFVLGTLILLDQFVFHIYF